MTATARIFVVENEHRRGGLGRLYLVRPPEAETS